MGQLSGYATGFASGFASGFTLPQSSILVTPSGLVAQVLARGVTTFQTAFVTPFATPFGGFYSYSGPQATPTTLDAVLTLVAATIAGAGIVAPAAALVSLDAEPFPATAGPQAVVVPGDFAARGSHQDGMGRNLATEDGSFVVHVADVSLRDQANQDSARLLGAPVGGKVNLLALAHQVKDLLNGQFVEDAAGNLLSIEPMFFRSQSRPRRYAADSGAQGWAGIDLTFSLSYAALMTDTATAEMGGP